MLCARQRLKFDMNRVDDTMVNDNRSAGPWQQVEYEGYEPLPIVDLKVHMLGESESGKPEGLLRIITDEGIEGWCNTIDPETARVITTQLREHLIGRDALARERLWHDLLMLERLTWPPKKLRGANDVALWDIAGKRLGLPVWRLLGACRDRVPCYRTQSGTLGPEGLTKDHFIQFALQVKEQGCLGSKDHCFAGLPPPQPDRKQSRLGHLRGSRICRCGTAQPAAQRRLEGLR